VDLGFSLRVAKYNRSATENVIIIYAVSSIGLFHVPTNMSELVQEFATKCKLLAIYNVQERKLSYRDLPLINSDALPMMPFSSDIP